MQSPDPGFNPAAAVAGRPIWCERGVLGTSRIKWWLSTSNLLPEHSISRACLECMNSKRQAYNSDAAELKAANPAAAAGYANDRQITTANEG